MDFEKYLINPDDAIISSTTMKISSKPQDKALIVSSHNPESHQILQLSGKKKANLKSIGMCYFTQDSKSSRGGMIKWYTLQKKFKISSKRLMGLTYSSLNLFNEYRGSIIQQMKETKKLSKKDNILIGSCIVKYGDLFISVNLVTEFDRPDYERIFDIAFDYMFQEAESGIEEVIQELSK